jgi:hypothetical protein
MLTRVLGATIFIAAGVFAASAQTSVNQRRFRVPHLHQPFPTQPTAVTQMEW